MPVGGDNMEIRGTLDIGHTLASGGASLEETIDDQRLSDKQIDRLIESLTDERMQNPNVNAYDEIHRAFQQNPNNPQFSRQFRQEMSRNASIPTGINNRRDEMRAAYMEDRSVEEEIRRSLENSREDNFDAMKPIFSDKPMFSIPNNIPIPNPATMAKPNNVQPAATPVPDSITNVKKEIDTMENTKNIMNEVNKEVGEKPESFLEEIEKKDTDTASSSIEENTETVIDDNEVIDEEGRTQAQIDDFNDVPATTLEVSDDVIKSKIAHDYGNNMSDEDASQLLSVMHRYRSGEKFNVFAALPPFIQQNIIAASMEAGNKDRSIINFFAKNFINDLCTDAFMDKEFTDFQEELKEATKGMDNISGMVIDAHMDELKEKFENNLVKTAGDIEAENPEKAEQLRNIASAFRSTYTLDKVMDYYAARPSLINHAKKSKFKDVCDSFDKDFANLNPKVRPLKSVSISLITKFGYDSVVAQTIATLVANSVYAFKDTAKTDVEWHIYAYYIIFAFININIGADTSEVTNTMSKSIITIANDVESYLNSISIKKKK